jgi:hypothetical protein
MNSQILPSIQADALKILLQRVGALNVELVQRDDLYKGTTLKFDFEKDLRVECYVSFDDENLSDDTYLEQIVAGVKHEYDLLAKAE